MVCPVRRGVRTLVVYLSFFFNDTATTEIYTLSLHDALPIYNMKKYGGFVPGIRPGRATAEYLDYILSRITTFGAIYLGGVAVVPYLLFSLTGGNRLPFGGIAILIIVGVGLETVKQVESQLMLRNYEGFLR